MNEPAMAGSFAYVPRGSSAACAVFRATWHGPSLERPVTSMPLRELHIGLHYGPGSGTTLFPTLLLHALRSRPVGSTGAFASTLNTFALERGADAPLEQRSHTER